MTDDRRYRALRLYRERRPFHEIGQELGCSTAEAWELVKSGNATTPASDVETERKRELDALDAEMARCDAIHTALAALSAAGVLDAIDRTLRATETKVHVSARRAKLLGLDSPTRTETTFTGGPSPADAARIVREAFGAVTPDDASDDGKADEPT